MGILSDPIGLKQRKRRGRNNLYVRCIPCTQIFHVSCSIYKHLNIISYIILCAVVYFSVQENLKRLSCKTSFSLLTLIENRICFDGAKHSTSSVIYIWHHFAWKLLPFRFAPSVGYLTKLLHRRPQTKPPQALQRVLYYETSSSLLFLLENRICFDNAKHYTRHRFAWKLLPFRFAPSLGYLTKLLLHRWPLTKLLHRWSLPSDSYPTEVS